MMCRRSAVEVESTFKIYKIVTWLKQSRSQLETSAAVHGVEINKYGAVTFTFQLQPQEQRSLRLPLTGNRGRRGHGCNWNVHKARSILETGGGVVMVATGMFTRHGQFFKLLPVKSAQGSEH